MSQLVDAALSPAACEAVALPITTQDPCQTPHHDCDAAATHHDRSVRESGDGQSSIIKAAEYASVEDRGTGKGTLGPKGPHGLSSSQSTKSIGSKKVNRPAWALTADAAQDAEQKEEEDLLAFAGGLEFDEYINEQEDAELRTALQVLLILLLWAHLHWRKPSLMLPVVRCHLVSSNLCTAANSLASMLQPAKHTIVHLSLQQLMRAVYHLGSHDEQLRPRFCMLGLTNFIAWALFQSH